VALRGLKLNPGLAVYLRKWVEEGRPADKATSVASLAGPPPGRQWRVRDRLGEADACELVEAFRGGTSKHKLAEQYGISLSSVKRVLRRRRAALP
jgi:DNA invertase Pin-like site-specific DNA recombinase